jgi:GntP family gluconate:H+ symporter
MNVLLKSSLVGISIIAIIVLTSRLKLKAFIALFLVSLFLAFTTLPPNLIVSTIKEGFGNTMASIGFLIILGAIIGITLDKTGGTISIANYILSKTGENKSALALGITGFITGLPIFCDSGFIILSGLAKSFSAKSKIAMPIMATVLATSLYSVHCLIPPHPGALAAAGVI